MSDNTLEDLAKKLAISRRTLSRVLKNEKNVAQDTRERISKHLEKEKVYPNVHAASLASKKINVIGMVFPKGTFKEADFFAIDTIKGIATATEENNYQLMIFTQDKFDSTQCLRLYKSKLVGGLILVSLTKEDFAQFSDLKKNQVPISLLFAYSEKIDSFGCDNQKGGYLATKHLIGLGRRKVAFIHGEEGWFDADERCKGYKQALAEAGIEFRPEYIGNGHFSYEGGEAVMKEMLSLDNPPDAVFAANDRSAIGAVRAIKEAGRRVPEDIAVVGFDNIPLCELLDPTITTIEHPIKDIAYEAAKTLLDLINNPNKKPSMRLFEPRLIIRKSA